MIKTKNIHAVALGKLGGPIGGKARSPRKTAAVRQNARKGGAPKGNQNWKGRIFMTTQQFVANVEGRE